MQQSEILIRIGDAQGKMLLARFEGNKEREEHYRVLQVSLAVELSKTKRELV